ncbi:MAG TPA: iron ABC transporter permease, partial [Tianweitania sediminis]|nr:iron ABC transporter permease [Tianweitania sediminis]
MTEVATLSENWRFRRPVGTRWRLGAAVVGAFACLPIAALVTIALQGSEGLWPHMFTHVLPSALHQTLILLVGVGLVVAVIGTTTAWLVSAYDFPGRSILDWALLLPLAVPTYIVAYAYLDILHPVGAVQGLIRDVLGYQSPREFRLPDIRSIWACILLLGLVLYPYVYLTTRAMFLTQAANVVEVSRTLGTDQRAVFFRVALPLARPAIAIGLSLALMETLNDIGASEFLGVKTLTVSIYTTWVTRNDLPAAAQIALAMLVIVVLLILLERYSRRNQRYAAGAQRPRALVPTPLRGLPGFAACLFCLVPVLLGFVAPAAYLLVEAFGRYQFAGISPRIWSEIVNTVSISALATAFILGCGCFLAYSQRSQPGRVTSVAARASTLGYAVPGT